jgi:ZIP family zinc transporter
VSDVLLAALPTGLATGLGALPFLFVKQLPRRGYDGVLGLGAGLMLAAATLGLLHEALAGVRTAAGLDLGRLALIAGGFLSGVLIAIAMDRLIPHGHARGHHQHIAHEPGHEGHHHHHGADHAPRDNGDRRRLYLVMGAMSIHRLPEGVAIGAGFASAEHRLGWLLVIAVGMQNVCEGMVMGAPLRQGGLSRTRALAFVSGSGLMVPFGALVGHALSELAVAALPFVLSLAAGTLIYVTSNEIIPESHSHGHEGTASAGLITGFLLTMVLDAIIH